MERLGCVAKLILLAIVCLMPLACGRKALVDGAAPVKYETIDAQPLERWHAGVAERVRGFSQVFEQRSYSSIPILKMSDDGQYEPAGAESRSCLDLYLKGGNDDLNRFLAGMATLKEADLSITFVPERGRYHLWYRENAELLPYNWRMSGVISSGLEKDGSCKLSIHVTVHVADEIRLEKMKLPLAFRALVGGRISKFVEGHNARIDDAAEKGAAEPDLRPTTESLLESRRIIDVFLPDEDSDSSPDDEDLLEP